ncbi:GNAT family N-acetyltransferase [Cellulomonas sp. URHB0016]
MGPVPEAPRRPVDECPAPGPESRPLDVRLVWKRSPVDDRLVALARVCRARDGGLPFTADPAWLARRWAGDSVRADVLDDSGALVGAAAVAPAPAGDAATLVGLVAPTARGRGLGARLLDAGLAEAAHVGAASVETEGLTEDARALFASRGLRQVFAEDVMSVDLTRTGPHMRWPDGVELAAWSTPTAGRFHAVHEAAFKEPGSPGRSLTEWVQAVEEPGFRPEWSVLARLHGRDVGFVTAADGWILQVGVVPEARGKGIGGALVSESLRRMRHDGASEAWLEVDVDNPGAAALYRRLGFEERGRRARFTAVVDMV